MIDPPAQRLRREGVGSQLIFGVHRRALALLLWLYVVALGLLSDSAAAQCDGRNGFTTPKVEVDALITLYQGFGVNNSGFFNWRNGDPCQNKWGGVVCQRFMGLNCNTTISGLQLTNLNIEGTLSSAIQHLANLTFLNIIGNPKLNGRIPSELGNLPELVILDLHSNCFNENIPVLKNLTKLQFLDLSGNQLTGPIPRWLGSLGQIQRLELSNNQLRGFLPFAAPNNNTGLDNLTFAVQMSFSNNYLSGPLDSLASLPRIRFLNGSDNQFNGTFPVNLLNGDGNLTKLVVLDLSNNNISGSLPTVRVQGLQEIYMSNNNLSGILSPSFLESYDLRRLNLDRNNISGSLTLSNTSNLQYMSLVDNNIQDFQFPQSWWTVASQHLAQNISSTNLLSNTFLGQNPYCNDPQTDLMLQICRSNANEILTRVVRNGTNNKMLITIGVIAGFIVLVAAIIALVIIRRLWKRIIVLRDIQREFAKNEVQPNLYSYTELKAATEDFSPNRRLGQGGFGVVYKGVLSDGTELAVKLLNNSNQVLVEFLNEIVTITNVRHKNLVKLKGCCVKGDQRLLVYEYVENKNLAEALWDAPSKGGRDLDWPARFNIILGVARGLAYLHEEVTPPIIHRDIKAANILLDKSLDPKIGDFGLALLFPALDDDRTHLSVNIAGTKGYLSPEYASFGQVSEKVDVFSFGILVLEIVSGRKNINLRLPAEQRYILEWAWKMYEAETLQDFIDAKLVDKSRVEDIKHVVKLGLACAQYTAARRPTMSSVVSILLGHQPIDNINRESEFSKGQMEAMFATLQTSSLTPVDEDSPLLVGLPTASASGAFIELGKLKPR